MELKKQIDAVELVNDLRSNAKKLRENGTLYHIAAAMDAAADMITEYVRKDIERG